ncbi:MAG: pantoate--beta-alanine ligase [Planctomycetales bacterium]
MNRDSAPPAAAPMIVVDSAADVRDAVRAARERGVRIALVPTMGALHAGHRSLLDAARQRCDFVVATIFVNPTQFGPGEDFSTYPRPIEADLDVCRAAGVDLVFRPAAETVYPSGFATFVEVAGLSDVLEGAFRPGHFRGVATIVLKLLNVVQPDALFVGQKDYQQQLLLRRMCADLDLPVEVVACPTVRDPDGLALSSRNVRLAPDDRWTALALSATLREVRARLLAGETDVAAVRREMRARLEAAPSVRVDYATVADADTLAELDSPRLRMAALVAARVGGVRLIDNLPIDLSVIPAQAGIQPAVRAAAGCPPAQA